MAAYRSLAMTEMSEGVSPEHFEGISFRIYALSSPRRWRKTSCYACGSISFAARDVNCRLLQPPSDGLWILNDRERGRSGLWHQCGGGIAPETEDELIENLICHCVDQSAKLS